jgi:hypothetical protein
MRATAATGFRPDGPAAHDNDVRILRVDNHPLDVRHVPQAHVRPGLATVRRSVKPITDRLLAGAHVDHVGIRWSHGNSSNGSDSFTIEDRTPDLSAVGGLPHAASRCTEIVGIGMARHTRYCRDPTGAKRADEPPLHGRELVAVDFLPASDVERQNRQECHHQ